MKFVSVLQLVAEKIVQHQKQEENFEEFANKGINFSSFDFVLSSTKKKKFCLVIYCVSWSSTEMQRRTILISANGESLKICKTNESN